MEIQYDGVQEDEKGNPAFHQFTIQVGVAKGATFSVEKYEWKIILKAAKKVINKFNKDLCDTCRKITQE